MRSATRSHLVASIAICALYWVGPELRASGANGGEWKPEVACYELFERCNYHAEGSTVDIHCDDQPAGVSFCVPVVPAPGPQEGEIQEGGDPEPQNEFFVPFPKSEK